MFSKIDKRSHLCCRPAASIGPKRSACILMFGLSGIGSGWSRGGLFRPCARGGWSRWWMRAASCSGAIRTWTGWRSWRWCRGSCRRIGTDQCVGWTQRLQLGHRCPIVLEFWICVFFSSQNPAAHFLLRRGTDYFIIVGISVRRGTHCRSWLQCLTSPGMSMEGLAN